MPFLILESAPKGVDGVIIVFVVATMFPLAKTLSCVLIPPTTVNAPVTIDVDGVF